MAILKCKMCGGDLNLIEGASTAACEYCGSMQTVPKVDDEKKLALFARANRLRAACDFDKAAGIYEAIVADFPEEAEAYWGMVLCKYGIEYVDDPATGKKIPTCHRSGFDSVMKDSNVELAQEYADILARQLYREEAKQIEELRKNIIAVSASEEPYDVFICYKETDFDGKRTLDSVLAMDIYEALTDKGYRVFFSRISLEDKLGTEYEPYIFAALNSAKIMLVIGTDYEHFNAVWVKNEWSRFLKLIAQDKSKHLIPCYKGIDVYDTPEEFARLQAQDLDKMGAVQDIVHGVQKLLPRQKETTVIHEQVFVGGGNKIASLLDRGNMALEDGDWAKADSFFEDVLNNDSKNAQAYLGKTLAQEKCRTIDAFIRKRKDALEKCRTETKYLPVATEHIEKKITEFTLADYVSRQKIERLYNFDASYCSCVAARQQQFREEETYWANHKLLARAEKFADETVAGTLQREKKALFAILSDRTKEAVEAEAVEKKNVQERYIEHLQQADQRALQLYNDGLAKREKDYQQLKVQAETLTDVQKLRKTAKKLEQLDDYQDSKNLAQHCLSRAAKIQAELDAEAASKAEMIRREEEARAKKHKKITIIVMSGIMVVIASLIVLTHVIIPNAKYNDAVTLMDACKYDEAIAAFEAMDGYKDSAAKILYCRYNEAVDLMDAGKYDEAIAAFEAIDGYKDSAAKILVCRYNKATDLMEAGQYGEAVASFVALGDYKDSIDQARKALFEQCKTATVGDYITFGSYEQDNNAANGAEAVEWKVLKKEDQRILVISKYILDCIPYNTSNQNVTWETCTLRTWLNHDFMNVTFNSEEQAIISTKTVPAADDSYYGTAAGNSTQDKIFVLSLSEAKTLIPSEEERKCESTKYALSNGTAIGTDENGYGWWWLRTPGKTQSSVACILWNGGTFDTYDERYDLGGRVDKDYIGIRPVMWIDLNF